MKKYIIYSKKIRSYYRGKMNKFSVYSENIAKAKVFDELEEAERMVKKLEKDYQCEIQTI